MHSFNIKHIIKRKSDRYKYIISINSSLTRFSNNESQRHEEKKSKHKNTNSTVDTLWQKAFRKYVDLIPTYVVICRLTCTTIKLSMSKVAEKEKKKVVFHVQLCVFFALIFIQTGWESGIKSLNHVWFPSEINKTKTKTQIKYLYFEMNFNYFLLKCDFFFCFFVTFSWFHLCQCLTCCNCIQHYDHRYYHIWCICII